MTNRDRDSVAKILGDIASRLESAPAQTEDAGKRYADRNPGFNQCAHQAGGLVHVCQSEARSLRLLIANYLTAAPAKPRRPRTRR